MHGVLWERSREKKRLEALDPIWQLLFTRIVNSAEKERKMAREDNYYSRTGIFLKYDEILCHY